MTGTGPYKYLLDLMEDTRGNYMTFSYCTIQATTYWDSSNKFDQQVYLTEILYSGNTQTAFSPKWKVVVDLRPRTDVDANAPLHQYHYWESNCLDSIDVQGADGTMVRKYVLNYEYGNGY